MMQQSILNLGCGEDHHPDALNVDASPAVEPDEVVDLDELPWPWESGAFDTVRAYHVLEHLDDLDAALAEIARVLRPGGTLVVKWPMGQNELADPDHGHRWIWDTPLYYCGERHWDVDVGLEVVHRSVDLDVHVNGLVGWVYKTALSEYHRRHGPGRWAFGLPATSGEFTVVFER